MLCLQLFEREGLESRTLPKRCLQVFHFTVLRKFKERFKFIETTRMTPLHRVCIVLKLFLLVQGGAVEIVALLEPFLAEIMAVDRWGNTPIHVAAAGCHYDVLKVLVRRANLDIDKVCDVSRTVKLCKTEVLPAARFFTFQPLRCFRRYTPREAERSGHSLKIGPLFPKNDMQAFHP